MVIHIFILSKIIHVDRNINTANTNIDLGTSCKKMTMHFELVCRKELETNILFVLLHYIQEHRNCIILRIFVWSWVTLNISMNLRRRKMMFIDLDSTKKCFESWIFKDDITTTTSWKMIQRDYEHVSSRNLTLKSDCFRQIYICSCNFLDAQKR